MRKIEMFLRSRRSHVKNKQGRPKEQLANAWTSKSSLFQPQQKQPPRKLMGPRSDPHIRGTSKKDNAMAEKWNEAFYHVLGGGIWQYHRARAVLTGNVSKDPPWRKKWIEEGEQQILLMISSCSGKDEHPLENRDLAVLQTLSKKCQIKPKGINIKVMHMGEKLSQLCLNSKGLWTDHHISGG